MPSRYPEPPPTFDRWATELVRSLEERDRQSPSNLPLELPQFTAQSLAALQMYSTSRAIAWLDGVGVVEWNGSDWLTETADISQATFDMKVYGESVSDALAHKLLKGNMAGAHSGVHHTMFGVESRPVGSGINGPASADYGITVSNIKQDFDTTTVVGELDGVISVVRQGGTGSDCCGYLANVAHYGTGFSALFEGVCSLISGAAITKAIRSQVGVVDNVTPQYIGHVIGADIGIFDIGLLIRSEGIPDTGFVHFMKCHQPDGTTVFQIDGDGSVEIQGILAIDGEQVVGPRDGGWTQMSGTGNKGTAINADTITATDANIRILAGRVKQMQDSFTITHGLLGA